MHNYSDLACANIIAGETIGTLKNLTYTISKDSTITKSAEILSKLNTIESLEELWNRNRYLGFIHTLRKLFFSDLNLDLAATIGDSLIKLADYESTLFDCLSSRGDASFEEEKGLFKWSMLKKSIDYKEAPAGWKAFRIFISTKNAYKEIDFFANSELLTEMSNAMIIAEFLLEFEQEYNSCDVRKIHTALEEIGAFDRWHHL